MSATDSVQMKPAHLNKLSGGELSPYQPSRRPQVSAAFKAINAEASGGRLHRLGPASEFDMPKTSATAHRYLPYLQQVNALIN